MACPLGEVGWPPAAATGARRVVVAGSVSRPIRRVFLGRLRTGMALGGGYLDLGSLVVALVPPGRPLMPNGIEVGVSVPRGRRVLLGEGRMVTSEEIVLPGPSWEPRPVVRAHLGFIRPFLLDCAALIGRGEGLTPAGDDLVAGYVAGRVLMHHERCGGLPLLGGRTTKLSCTLLRHAVKGEVPQPMHDLLERGDAEPLLSFGHSSGRWLLIGLCLAADAERAARVAVPGDLSRESADRLLARCVVRS